MRDPWIIEPVSDGIIARASAAHVPNAEAVAAGVDVFGSPQRQDAEGRNWALVQEARRVDDVVPGSVITLGSRIGTYLAKVVAWDLAGSVEDPTILLELLPVTPDAVERALARRSSSSA